MGSCRHKEGHWGIHKRRRYCFFLARHQLFHRIGDGKEVLNAACDTPGLVCSSWVQQLEMRPSGVGACAKKAMHRGIFQHCAHLLSLARCSLFRRKGDHRIVKIQLEIHLIWTSTWMSQLQLEMRLSFFQAQGRQSIGACSWSRGWMRRGAGLPRLQTSR